MILGEGCFYSMGNIETTNEDVSIADNGLDGVDDSMDI